VSATRISAAVLLAAVGCVSFDAAGPAVPDMTGTYATTITLTLSNDFETRADTVVASFALRNTGERGRFTGTYAIAVVDSGPIAGAMAVNATLVIDTLGAPPKPIAGVKTFRLRYPWCDFTLLGMPALSGALAGDTLRASVTAALPCLYQVNGATLTVHTDLDFELRGVR